MAILSYMHAYIILYNILKYEGSSFFSLFTFLASCIHVHSFLSPSPFDTLCSNGFFCKLSVKRKAERESQRASIITRVHTWSTEETNWFFGIHLVRPRLGHVRWPQNWIYQASQNSHAPQNICLSKFVCTTKYLPIVFVCALIILTLYGTLTMKALLS